MTQISHLRNFQLLCNGYLHNNKISAVSVYLSFHQRKSPTETACALLHTLKKFIPWLLFKNSIFKLLPQRRHWTIIELFIPDNVHLHSRSFCSNSFKSSLIIHSYYRGISNIRSPSDTIYSKKWNEKSWPFPDYNIYLLLTVRWSYLKIVYNRMISYCRLEGIVNFTLQSTTNE